MWQLLLLPILIFILLIAYAKNWRKNITTECCQSLLRKVVKNSNSLMKTVRQSSICFSIMSWGLLENIGQWRCSVFSIRCHHKSQLLCLISESGPHISQSNTKQSLHTKSRQSVGTFIERMFWQLCKNQIKHFALRHWHCKMCIKNMNNCVHQKLYIISGAHNYAQMQKNCLIWRLLRWPILNQLHINF